MRLSEVRKTGETMKPIIHSTRIAGTSEKSLHGGLIRGSRLSRAHAGSVSSLVALHPAVRR